MTDFDHLLREEIPDAVMVATLDGKLVHWTRGAEIMFGYESAEATGASLDLIVPTDLYLMEQAALKRTIVAGANTWESIFRRKDGSLVYTDTSGKIVRGSGEEDKLLIISAKDVTRLRAFRDKAILQERADSMRLLIESIQEYAIYMLDAGGCVATWNAGAERITSYRVDEIIGKHFSCFFLEEDKAAERPEAALRAALANGHAQDEGWRLRKDGRKFWARVTLSRLLDEEGRLLGFSNVTRDRTERRKIEMILHEKNVELQNAALAKDQFLANMSHELRTPLNGIIGFAEFLTDEKPGPLNPKQKEYLGDILQSGKHLLHVINDVLDLAKVEAGKMELRPERFSLRTAIDDVHAGIELAAQKKRLRVDIDIAPDLDEVTLDRKRFKQVLYNLLSNAVKFTNEDGQTQVIAAKIDDDRFKVVVKDTGIGIKAQNLTRLFKEFEQIDPDRWRDQGTGLGLVLTQRIVQLHGGTISVESEFGKGTTFTVVLPLVLPQAEIENRT